LDLERRALKTSAKVLRSVPRKAALRILTEVLSNRKPLDEALDLHASDMESKDRAWLTEVSSGVLRNMGRIDQVIDAYALKKKPSGKIRKLLQLATYQLLHQDRVFPATVVSETVDFIRSEEGDAPSRFANAILRKVADARTDWLSASPPQASAPLAEKAAWANLPGWWWKRWEKEYGYALAMRIAEASLSRPETWFRVRSGKLPDFLEAGPIAGSARQKKEGEELSRDVTALPGFREGEWIIQDLASQTLAMEFSKRLAPGARLLDRCAAPGGKSVSMAWLGFQVVATDEKEQRLKLLNETLGRASPDVEIVEATVIAEKGPYDAVWIDAPCSGSGILRRHPDVRWLKREQDLAELVRIQESLLKEAYSLVASGGWIFYSVCSLFAEEGRAHVERLASVLGTDRFKVHESYLLGPHETPSSDGFFGVAIRKD
jgi:16S rRNA (cytosine967-C5)-methyltransferase